MFSRKRAISFLCAACMLCSLIIMALPAPVYGTGLSEQLEQARQEKEALENQIKAIRADKNKVLQQKKLLDQRNETLRNEVNLIQKQSDETQARIVDLTAKEEQQYALFCRQVRAEEERGTESYWSVIFKSADFADLLARLDFVSEVMDYDRKVIEDLQATRQQLTEDKAALERQKAELVSAQAELQKDIDEAAALVRDYEKSEAGHNAMLSQAKQDEERIQELIRQQQQSSGSSDGYIWPSNNSHLITDSYGWRICPFHGREHHNGIDIGARWGTDVLASSSGTVIQSGWNGGYGISVVISHPDGITTLYGHMSSTKVSKGQTVSKGQVIGACGSTGNSTGAHIHFTMYKGSSTVNPLDYLP